MKKIIFLVMVFISINVNATTIVIMPRVAPATAHVAAHVTAPVARPVVRTYQSPRAATVEPMDSQYRAAPVVHPAPVVVPHSSCTDEKRKKKEC